MAEKFDQMQKQLEQALEQSAGKNALPKQLPLAISGLIEEGRRVTRSQRILSSLRYEYMEARRDAIPKRFAQTFEWIFKSPETLLREKGVQVKFIHWLRFQSEIFWISGKAGSGKSTLMKFLCDYHRTRSELKRWSKQDKLIIAQHFFWNAGNAVQKSQKGLIRALCYEVLRQCTDLIPKICRERWDETDSHRDSKEWTREELGDLVIALSSQQLKSDGQSVRFCFFIDGLDEYEGEHLEIINMLQQLASSEHIKVCASSRPWNVFQNAFGGDRNRMLILQELTRDDIRSYVKQNLEDDHRFLRLKQEDPQCTELVAEVTDKANGVFLWVFLVVRQLRRSLENADSVYDLQRRLRELPPGLEEYFQRMFDTIEGFYKEQAAQIFLVCMHASVAPPLLGFAIFEPGDPLAARMLSKNAVSAEDIREMERRLEKRINGRCRDLLEVIQDRDRHRSVGFLHRTVKDFLTTKDTTNLLIAQAGQNFDVLRKLCSAYILSFTRLGERYFNGIVYYARKIEFETKESAFDILSLAHETLNKQLAANARAVGGIWLKIEDVKMIREVNQADRFTALAVERGLTLYVQHYIREKPQAMTIHEDPSLLCIALERAREIDSEEEGVSPDMVRMLLHLGSDANALVTVIGSDLVGRAAPGMPGAVQVSAWDFFLGCIYSAQAHCPPDQWRKLTETAEAMINAGAEYIDRCATGIVGNLGIMASTRSEEAVLISIFGAAEAERLSQLRRPQSPIQPLPQIEQPKRWRLYWWK